MDPLQNAYSSQLTSIPRDFLAEGSSKKLKVQDRLSHYGEAIASGDGLLHGKSRNWGDSDQAGQLAVIAAIIKESASAGLNREQTAFALAVARVESGFNPDAASTTTSAAGLGQFIDETAKGYGISRQERFNFKTNARAMVEYLKDSLRAAQGKLPRGKDERIMSLAYALYHDGPSLNHGGMVIAEKKVMPWTERFSSWLKQNPGVKPQ